MPSGASRYASSAWRPFSTASTCCPSARISSAAISRLSSLSSANKSRRLRPSRRTRPISFARTAKSMGFGTKPFIPASRASLRSSSKALAVRAIIGMDAAWGWMLSRILRAASSPPRTGICKSMRITSYVSSGASRKRVHPSSPFRAVSTAAPMSPESISTAISRLTALSSTTSKRTPFNSPASPPDMLSPCPSIPVIFRYRLIRNRGRLIVYLNPFCLISSNSSCSSGFSPRSQSVSPPKSRFSCSPVKVRSKRSIL